MVGIAVSRTTANPRLELGRIAVSIIGYHRRRIEALIHDSDGVTALFLQFTKRPPIDAQVCADIVSDIDPQQGSSGKAPWMLLAGLGVGVGTAGCAKLMGAAIPGAGVAGLSALQWPIFGAIVGAGLACIRREAAAPGA